MRFPSIVRHLMLIAALVSAPSCGGGDPTSPPTCASAVAVSVGRGLQPNITWEPACAAITVAVAPAGLGVPVWQTSVLLGAGLTPPVQVGATPPGTTVWGAGIALSAGSTYTAYVAYGGRAAPTGGLDSLTFTAQP